MATLLNEAGYVNLTRKKILPKVQYLIHLIIQKRIFSKGSWKEYYALRSKTLKVLLGARYVAPIKRALIDIGIIEIRRNKKGRETYEVKGKSKQFRIESKYHDSKISQIQIDKRFAMGERCLAKEIAEEVNEGNRGLQFIYQSQQRVSLDAEAARRACNHEIAPEKPESALQGIFLIDKIENGIFLGSTDRNGRYYHNYTSMNKELRQFVTFKGERLQKVDVTSSHLCFMSLLYKEETQEKKNFIEALKAGCLYETINEALPQPFDLNESGTRSAVKRDFFEYGLFSAEETSPTKPERREKKRLYREAFSQVFPELAAITKCMRKKNHAYLSNLLMEQEAEVMMERVAPRLAVELGETDAVLLSLHDCFVTQAAFVEAVGRVIKEEYSKIIGFSPHLKASAF